jgi:hypothetical protein
MSATSFTEILDAMMRAGEFFYLTRWAGMPRLWSRTTRGYVPVSPSRLQKWLRPVAGEVSHALAVQVLDSDLSSCFPPVPEAST